VPLDGGVNPCTKLWGHRPLKIRKDKKRPKFGAIKTNFDFDREYLWKGLRYQQSVNGVINYPFFRVEQKKT